MVRGEWKKAAGRSSICKCGYLSGTGYKILIPLAAIIAAFVTVDVVYGLRALYFVPVAVVSVAFSVLVSIRVSDRMKKLEMALSEMDAGNLDHRVRLGGNDDMARLGRSINSMAATLGRKADELDREKNRLRSIHQGISDGVIVFDNKGRVFSANPAAEAALGILEKEMHGRSGIGVPEIENIVSARELVPYELKARCWEEKNCRHADCPSYESSELQCWLQCGTYCHDEIQGTFSQKRDACERCDVYMKNGIRNIEVSIDGSSYAVSINPIIDQNGQEEGRMAVLHDITEVNANRGKLTARNQELTVLNEIAVELTQSMDDLDIVLKKAVAKITDAVSVDAAAIMLFEPDGGSMRLRHSLGLSPQTGFLIQTLATSSAREVLNADESRLLKMGDIFKKHAPLRVTLKNEGFRHSSIVPLWVKGDVIGAILLADRKRDEFTTDEIRLLNAAAAHMGAAIKNAELFASIASSKKAWETTFNAMSDAVSVHDCNYNILRVNSSMAAMLGCKPDDLVGRKCYQAVHGLDAPPPECPARKVLECGMSATAEIANDREDRTIRLSINPFRSAEGRMAGYVHVMRDITERKMLREQLLQSEKMAAVGQLVSGVAHELNNPLTGVLGYSQLLTRKCDDELRERIGDDLQAIAGEAQRASRIVQNLLSFARKHKSQKTLADINEAIRTVIELRTYELRVRNIEIRSDLDTNLPRTMIDTHQLEQVLLNIVNNAEQAILDTGRPGAVEIVTRKADQAIEISVSDTGRGIPPETLSRIFEPFFTTKDVGKGTGLGLSICYGIIEDHGGTIRAASREGEGTTMVIELPVMTRLKDDVPAADSDLPGGGRKKVLLVDDERAIVDLLTDLLTMEGHGVDVVDDGSLALKKLSNGHYDSVIIDFSMPDMDGRELHRRIREINPSLAANMIFIASESMTGDVRDFMQKNGNFFLVKPFNLHDLRENINKVMNGHEQ